VAKGVAKGVRPLFHHYSITVTGFKDEIDGTDWIITECRHRIGDGGYTTEISAEMKSA